MSYALLQKAEQLAAKFFACANGVAEIARINGDILLLNEVNEEISDLNIELADARVNYNELDESDIDYLVDLVNKTCEIHTDLIAG